MRFSILIERTFDSIVTPCSVRPVAELFSDVFQELENYHKNSEYLASVKYSHYSDRIIENPIENNVVVFWETI